MQSIIERGVNVENGKQVRKLECALDVRVEADQFQRTSAGSNPHMHDHQLAETGAVDCLQLTEFDDDLACMGEKLRYFLGERGGFITIGEAALAQKHGDIVNCAGLQI